MFHIRALFLGLFLALCGQGLYAEHKEGAHDFHMGPVPNEHHDGHGHEAHHEGHH